MCSQDACLSGKPTNLNARTVAPEGRRLLTDERRLAISNSHGIHGTIAWPGQRRGAGLSGEDRYTEGESARDEAYWGLPAAHFGLKCRSR
jgi:hypothetical protein